MGKTWLAFSHHYASVQTQVPGHFCLLYGRSNQWRRSRVPLTSPPMGPPPFTMSHSVSIHHCPLSPAAPPLPFRHPSWAWCCNCWSLHATLKPLA